MSLEPLVRLDSALSLWGGAAAPERLQGRGCLFVMRFPGLLFDAPGYGKVLGLREVNTYPHPTMAQEWEDVDFERVCEG